MNKNHIIIALLVILLVALYLMRNKSEHATLTTQSNEAVQNVASVYSDVSGTITVNNLHVTGKLTADGPTAFFKGIIVAWSGSTADIANISSGWGLCDGTTYRALDSTQLPSPDLRSKFILGASKPNTDDNNALVGPSGQPLYIDVSGKTEWLTPQQVGTQDGEETHVLLETEMPSHSHTIPLNGNASLVGNTYGGVSSTNLGSGPTSSVGGGQPHNNMPPYYALAYIIKL